MLERIREGSQSPWAIGILGLIILSFIFAGVGGYMSNSASTAAATVNGDEITLDELERAYQNERARMEQQFGDAFATLASDTEYLRNFRSNILDRLIGETLIDQAAVELGLRVSDEQVKNAIISMNDFHVDGQFNNDRYIALLRQAGFQPSNFRDFVRTDLIRRQLSQSLIGTEFALDSEAVTALKMREQTRDIRYLIVATSLFADKVDVSDQQVSDYYDANINQFDTEQKVSLEYVELTLEDVLKDISVSEQELAEYYQQNINSYRTEEERQVSHILLEFGDDEDAAKVKAEEVLAKVNSGENFAELAKSFSSDTFSAENGGDLGFFSKGIMDPAFEDAAFELAQTGDVSGLVKSAFGYHIIKLTDVKAEQVTPFSDVQEQVELAVKTFKAEEEFYVIQQNMAEVAFEIPDSLEGVAAAANKSAIKTELFARSSAPAGVSHPQVLASAFSDALIQEGVNSEVIEVAKNHIVVARVAEFEPERTQLLDEVSQTIKQRLVAEASQQAAKDYLSEIQANLSENADVSAQLGSLDLVWQDKSAITRNDSSVSRPIISASFALAKNDSEVVELFNEEVALVQVQAINIEAEVDQSKVASLQTQLASSKTQNLYAAVIESLKAQADIEIY